MIDFHLRKLEGLAYVGPSAFWGLRNMASEESGQSKDKSAELMIFKAFFIRFLAEFSIFEAKFHWSEGNLVLKFVANNLPRGLEKVENEAIACKNETVLGLGLAI